MFDNHLILILIKSFAVHHSDWSNISDRSVDAFTKREKKGKKEKNTNMLHQQIVLFRTQNKLCDSGMAWR